MVNNTVTLVNILHISQSGWNLLLSLNVKGYLQLVAPFCVIEDNPMGYVCMISLIKPSAIVFWKTTIIFISHY